MEEMMRNMVRIAGAALLIAGLAGCADTHTVQRITQSQQKLAPIGSAYVAMAQDGQYGRTTYTGSGKKASTIVAEAFGRRLPVVHQALSAEPHDKALVSARRVGAKYLIIPDIVHWEDRATGWSGKPDRAEMRITVIDVASEAVLTSSVVGGKSRWATMSDDKPEELLPIPTEDYVASLF